jgi:hypothetical protein
VRRTRLAQVEFVFELAQGFVVDAAQIAQAHGSLPFHPQQFAGDVRQPLVMFWDQAACGIVFSRDRGQALLIVSREASNSDPSCGRDSRR